MLKCIYCDRTGTEMFVVQKADLPPKQPHRWREIGYCCDFCDADGAKKSFEFGERHKVYIKSFRTKQQHKK